MTDCLGRSSWTIRGGPDPNYTLLTPNIGQWYVSGLNRTPDYEATWYGVREIQRALLRRGYNPGIPDGWFGTRTAAAVRAFKKVNGRPDNPKVGNLTARVLFGPDVLDAVVGTNVSSVVLCGLISKESSWDPGAVGCQTPDDLGTCQINTNAHTDVTRDQAFNVLFALKWTVLRLADAARTYDSFTFTPRIPQESFLIAQHNWPSGATTWAKTGVSPRNSVNGELLSEYVALVQAACA